MTTCKRCGAPLVPIAHQTEGWGSYDACSRCEKKPDHCTCAEKSMPDGWELPAPLGRGAELPAFPVDALPDWVRQEVTGLAEFTQTPTDLGGTIGLAVLSASAGGRAVVEVRGSWREPVNLHTVTAMPPGSRKSAVFAELVGPLLDAEQSMIEITRPQVLEAETQRKVAQKAAEQATTKAGAQDGKDDAKRQEALANAISAAQMAEAVTVPTLPRLVADDVTPEAAATLLAEQGGRLAIMSAEGGIFSTLAGRYSGMPSLEVFLKGHAGDMLRVDRKGRPPEHVAHPALTLGLAVQPEVLTDIAQLPGFRGRGLLARILYSLPANLVGRRVIGAPPIAESVRATYSANVRTLTTTLAEWTDPAVLVLTPEAGEIVLQMERELEPRLAEHTGDLAGIVDWASKLVGAVVRIAGLLHLAGDITTGWSKPINADTMRNAVRLGGYFTAHALATFDAMGADPQVSDARVILEWLRRTKPMEFTRRELFSGISRSRFRKVGDLDVPLELVEQHGYIRRKPEPERTGPGRRPSPTYEVHPSLAAETA
ncbi:YfjI family protein [Streptosporangium sp. NPDC002524]|uniref:YfjI family protein n=1 Tax=Streptosporangium sp. NPDC002524 TaxID=3154537 RepID=UPI0033230076